MSSPAWDRRRLRTRHHSLRQFLWNYWPAEDRRPVGISKREYKHNLDDTLRRVKKRRRRVKKSYSA